MRQGISCLTNGIIFIIILIICVPHEVIDSTSTNQTTKLGDMETEYVPSSTGHLTRANAPLSIYHPQFVIYNGRIRSYWLHIPRNYEAKNPTPMLIALHAGGSCASRMMLITNLTAQAEKYNFIIVYPNGITRCNPFWRMWNGGYCCGFAYERNVDDVGYIRTLIQHLQLRYNIDTNRIYITGHSNGAILAYRLAAELSEIIAAVAPVAGTIGGTASENSSLYVIPDPEQPVSVIAFHGRLDDNVPYEGGRSNKSWGTGVDLSVNESINFWVLHDNCTPIPKTITSPSGNIIIHQYTNGYNGTEVILYTIVNGGHGWPGSAIGDRPTHEISASSLMCEFFMLHSKEI